MGQYTHMGQNTYTFFVLIARFWRLLIGFNNYIRGVDQNRRHRGHAISLQKVNPRDLDDGRLIDTSYVVIKTNQQSPKSGDSWDKKYRHYTRLFPRGAYNL